MIFRVLGSVRYGCDSAFISRSHHFELTRYTASWMAYQVHSAMMNCWKKRASGRLSALLAMCLALAGCGQKGPLYFPDEEEDKDKRAALERLERSAEHGSL